jgi:putative membrane protein
MSIRRYIQTFAVGLAMGIANVIPGVSGGTIALVGGVYTDIFSSLRRIDKHFIRLLLRFQWFDAIKYVNGGFLAMLFFGVVVGIIVLANVLSGLLCAYPMQVNALFFGLILASVYTVIKWVDERSMLTFVLFIVGVAIAMGIGFLPPMKGGDGFVYMALCGLVAACSMVLPGLSGSYILLLMGSYATVVNAVSDIEFSILVPLAIGAGFGLLALTRIIAMLFDRAKSETLALMAGFVFGSLYVIWPWKEAVYQKNAQGESLDKYGQLVANACEDGLVVDYVRWIPSSDSLGDVNFWIMLGFMVLGVGAVLGIEYLGKENNG